MPSQERILKGLNRRLDSCLQEKFAGKPARMAKAAGIGESTVRGWFEKWNAGEAVNPNALALFKVAQACGVTVEWLISGQDPAPAMSLWDELDTLKLPPNHPGKLTDEEKYILLDVIYVLHSEDAPGNPARVLRKTIEGLHAAVVYAREYGNPGGK